MKLNTEAKVWFYSLLVSTVCMAYVLWVML